MLDQRPKNSGLVSLCEENHIDILAYGVLAGGFLTDNWLGKNKPQKEVVLQLKHLWTVLYSGVLL